MTKNQDQTLPLEPVGYRLLVEVEPIEQTTAHGFHIHANTDDAKREQKFQEWGTVRALGPLAYEDKYHSKAWVKVGDEVYFRKYEGWFYEDKDSERFFHILNDTDIMAIKRTPRGDK